MVMARKLNSTNVKFASVPDGSGVMIQNMTICTYIIISIGK